MSWLTALLFNPYYFNKISARLLPFLTVSLLVLTVSGIYYALIASPSDYQQGEMVRIMYVHVPSAWMALGTYVFMAICSFVNIVWRLKIAYLLARAAAPIGALFALITLVTGSLWGKPIWGTWWVWDGRLTSMLILFLLYLSYIAVVSSSSSNIARCEKPAAVIALIGFINIPIIKFSVDIWYSLHQPASVIRLGGPTIHSSMLLPLLLVFTSFIVYFLIVLLMKTRMLLLATKKL